MGRIADHAYDGLAVTDSGGHVVYSNAAYLALTGAATAQDVRPVERVFIGNPDVSEAVFRLLKAAREGKRQQEEVRIAGHDGAHGRWLRMRVRPLGQSKREAKYAVWSIADITRDRERQEDVFQELQHAIEYLDHAPCGFFSVNPAGELVYVNATLANWLDHDLAEIGSGGLKLTDIVSGDGASLLTSIVPVPGEVKTEVFDIDLRMRSGKTMPVRLYHKLAFGADGAPGASRTLVISRARDERSDPRARRRSPLHALLRSYPDGDRDRRPRRHGGARQCPLRQAGAEPRAPTAPPASRSSAPSMRATAAC